VILDLIDPDPAGALLKIAAGFGIVVLGVILWFQLQHRSRRYGGGNVAAVAMLAAVVALLVGLAPDVLPFELGIIVLFVGLAAILRPEQVVALTGGPSLRYRALGEGRGLQLLVRERGGWSVAGRNEEVQGKVEALSALEGPETERYLGLLRETLFADPGAPGTAERLEALAAADAELRVSLRARPMFERELAKRAAALDGGEVSGEG